MFDTLRFKIAVFRRRLELRWQLWIARNPKVARMITSMEINISALWRTFTTPFRWIFAPFLRVLGLQARSRRGRMSQTEKQLRKIKLLRLAAVFGLILVIGGVTTFFALFAWFSRDLPQPGQVVRREGFSTQFYDRDGDVLYDLFTDERREPVDFDEIPIALKQATVAVEDKDFYRHSGFDVLTIVRIPYNYIFRQRVVGGSTLTQQLVKNVLLTNERTVIRKFKEFVLALQIERTFTKDEILEMYLNEAPYGGPAWGVGAAADTYFGKDVSELTLTASVILA